MTQLECGLGPQFFSINPAPYECIIEHTWVSSLWQFLYDTNIILELPTHSLDLRFSYDTYLMPAFSRHFCKNDLKSINYCRIFLKVNTLSDIISLCGRRIKANCWKGLYHSNNLSTLIWPNQPKPSATLWNLWKKALQVTFQLDSLGQFSQPINIASFSPRLWKWFYDTKNQRIYEYNTDGIYIIWTKLPTSRSRKPTFQCTSLTDSAEPACPCTIVQRRAHIVLESYYQDHTTHRSTLSPQSMFSDQLHSELIGSSEILIEELLATWQSRYC